MWVSINLQLSQKSLSVPFSWEESVGEFKEAPFYCHGAQSRHRTKFLKGKRAQDCIYLTQIVTRQIITETIHEAPFGVWWLNPQAQNSPQRIKFHITEWTWTFCSLVLRFKVENGKQWLECFLCIVY